MGDETAGISITSITFMMKKIEESTAYQKEKKKTTGRGIQKM